MYCSHTVINPSFIIKHVLFCSKIKEFVYDIILQEGCSFCCHLCLSVPVILKNGILFPPKLKQNYGKVCGKHMFRKMFDQSNLGHTFIPTRPLLDLDGWI